MLRRRIRPRNVDHGHVACPLEGRDVDVERCWSCSHLIDITTEPGLGDVVRCDPSPVLAAIQRARVPG